ncbi:TPA: hypothetical protein HA273_05910 [Candidatus Bathyarchaeota archaeon]|nr:hypothetical protein [Candidatus Bathyarchaeota archaeon]
MPIRFSISENYDRYMDRRRDCYHKLVKNGEVLKTKKSYRRGYPVAMLLGFEEHSVALWSVFSKVVKPLRTLRTNGNPTDPKALYNLYECTIDALRPSFKEGVRSVILVSPPKTSYSKDFRNHVEKHHSWLVHGTSKTAFAELAGNACTIAHLTSLTRNPAFQKIVNETTTEENTNLIELIEIKLNVTGPKDNVLYSLEEAESLMFRSKTNIEPEYLLLTDKYLAENPRKGRINKLLQIAANKKIKTRIVKADSAAGKRLSQLGGFVCIVKVL